MLSIYTYVATSNVAVVVFDIKLFVQCSTPFIEIGRTHCSYKSFYSSLRPRATLESQIMGLWTENSNKVSKEASKNSAKELKKYSFSCYLTVSFATWSLQCFLLTCFIIIIFCYLIWYHALFLLFAQQMRLTVDPEVFDAEGCLREFTAQIRSSRLWSLTLWLILFFSRTNHKLLWIFVGFYMDVFCKCSFTFLL